MNKCPTALFTMRGVKLNMNTFADLSVCFIFSKQSILFHYSADSFMIISIMQLVPRLFNQQTVIFSKHSELERASHWNQSLSGKDDHPRFIGLFPRWLGKR